MSLEKGTVLIIHPEGNLNNNPTLSALTIALCRKGLNVTVFSPWREYTQEPIHPNVEVVLYPLYQRRVFSLLNRDPLLLKTLKPIALKYLSRLKADLILGVDREGIILASLLARYSGTKYGLLSFELTFSAEVGHRRKLPEIQACEAIEFALVQDTLRGQKLSKENNIHGKKLFYAPVAGSGRKRSKKGNLRQLLDIPESKKIAVSIGSTGSWTMIPEVLKTLPCWPPDWCLVIHNRYGYTKDIEDLVKSLSLSNVYVSPLKALPTEDLGLLLGDADLGIGFYFPDYSYPLLGRNLKYIGYSSGKTSTYLQYGVPVLTNNIGPLSEDIEKYQIGSVVNEIQDIPLALQNVRTKSATSIELCQNYFQEKLDALKTLPPVVDFINNMINSHMSEGPRA